MRDTKLIRARRARVQGYLQDCGKAKAKDIAVAVVMPVSCAHEILAEFPEFYPVDRCFWSFDATRATNEPEPEVEPEPPGPSASDPFYVHLSFWKPEDSPINQQLEAVADE